MGESKRDSDDDVKTTAKEDHRHSVDEKKKKKKKKNEGEAEQQEKKKKEGKQQASPSGVVVLRVDLHCDGCALKVRKAIKGAAGVERVTTDVAASTVTVTGKPDPWELKDRVEARARKPVAFVSPADPPKKKTTSTKGGGDTKPAADSAAANKEKNTTKEPPEATVVLKIRLHCNGCIDRIKRTAQKIKGVKQVTVDTDKHKLTVKGTMDAKTLPDVLRRKLKREVTVVVLPPPKKGSSSKPEKKKQGADKKPAAAAGDENSEASSAYGGGGKKKNKNQHLPQGEADHEDVEQNPTYGGYRVEMLHAPQLFSDENPNACSVM